MAAVARAGPHRGVEDDEVVAHYARAGAASPGVIRIDQLVEGVVGSVATTLHPTNADRPRLQEEVALITAARRVPVGVVGAVLTADARAAGRDEQRGLIVHRSLSV